MGYFILQITVSSLPFKFTRLIYRIALKNNHAAVAKLLLKFEKFEIILILKTQNILLVLIFSTFAFEAQLYLESKLLY